MPCKFRCLRLAVSISTTHPRLASCGTAYTLQHGTFTHRTSSPLLDAPYKAKEKPCKASLSEQVMGIEPTYLAWKASVLPLNYTCIYAIY